MISDNYNNRSSSSSMKLLTLSPNKTPSSLSKSPLKKMEKRNSTSNIRNENNEDTTKILNRQNYNLSSGYSSFSNKDLTTSPNQYTECVAKCTCLPSSNINLVKSPIRQVICDAATSPGRIKSHIKSPERFMQCNLSNDLNIVSRKPSHSPRRIVTTRNAATSPNLDFRKITTLKNKNGNNQTEKKSIESSSNRNSLEKSNSLAESETSETTKQVRQLRTTRSLSPRPPIRHQHAITVSDENDIVSVKVSPNDDFGSGNGGDLNDNPIRMGTKKKYKAKSENTSPNISDLDAEFLYEKQNVNTKSTSCLVYIPSDPWLKMTDGTASLRKIKEPKKIDNLILMDIKSLSRPKLKKPINSDPWIYRSKPLDFINNNASKRSPKQEKYRKAKSFSATTKDFAEKLNNRPILQRSKSPLIIDDDYLPPQSPSSPLLLVPDPHTAYVYPESIKIKSNSPRKEAVKPQANKTFLNVQNPNLILSRHSFSSISNQKEDELQLNIRRLSEQMKNPKPAVPSGADFSDYLKQFRCSEAKKAAEAEAEATITNRDNIVSTKTLTLSNRKTDKLLETTC